MRSFKGYKASTLPTWLGIRVASSAASLAQIVDELRQAGTDPRSTSSLRPVKNGPVSRTSSLRAGDCRPTRGVATISAGGSGSTPSRRKDPAFLLGVGWEGGGKDVAVAVWWDFENCNVPVGIEVYKVGVNIMSGLRMCGFKGPVSISAYGDILQLSRSTQEALASTGIRLHHIPSGGKDSSDRALLVDLMLWTLEHPPPAHLFLISGDRDFSNALHRLRMMNYNILLACPAGAVASPALLGAATQVWQWNSLVRGEGLVSMNPSSESRSCEVSSGAATLATKKPNPSSSHEHPIPPDGAANPDGASMCRPIATVQGLKATDDMKESPNEVKVSRPTADSRLREVPKEVVQQFHNLLVSHPNGIMLTHLQKYMSNDKVIFEKDFYGHGKIVPFLSSIPHVVRVEKVLMKDNKSWSYLLKSTAKSTAKSAKTKQQGTNTTADSPISTKVIMDQEAPKTSKHALKSPETPAVAVSRTALEVGNSSAEHPTETSTDDRQIPALQAVEEAQSKGSESSTKEVIQLNGESPAPCLPSETPGEVEKIDQRDVRVDEKAPSPGLNSFLSSLMSMLRGRQKDKAADNK